MELQIRGDIFYACGRVGGRLKRISTGIRVGGREARVVAKTRLRTIEADLRNAEAKAKANGATTTETPASEYPTFGEWVARYQATYARKKAVTTQRRERFLIAPALQAWADRRLDTLKDVDVQEFLTARQGAPSRLGRGTPPISESTRTRESVLLSSLFKRARENYAGLPAISCSLKYDTPVRERVITLEEQAEMLRRLPKHYHILFLILLGTGCRLSEALGIREKDIDWTHGFVAVLGKGNKWRRVPMLPGVAALFRAQLTVSPALWADWRPTSVDAAFQKACKERRGPRKHWPAIERITPHTCRHTFGWRWLTGNGDRSKRGDIYVLSKILGHKNIAVTQKHYAHLFDTDLRDAMLDVEVGISMETVQPWCTQV